MGKLFLVLLALAAAAVAWSSYKDSKLSPAEKHARECQNHTMAVVMALSFAKSRLNLAEKPDNETSGTWKVAKPIGGAGPGCAFEVADHIVFKNEMGGKSRRFMRAVVEPMADKPGSWRLRELSVN